MQLTALLTTLTLLASPAFTLLIFNEIIESHLEGSLRSSNKVKITEGSLDGSLPGSNPIKTPRARTIDNSQSKHHMISSPKTNKRETCAYSSCEACYKEDNACKICSQELDNLGPCIICQGNCRRTCC